MLLKDFRPESRLVTRTTLVERPRFEAIDAPNHLAAPFGGGCDDKPLSQLLDKLDAAGVSEYVDLDGGWGTHVLHRHLDLFKSNAPARFRIFTGVDWSQSASRGSDMGPDLAAYRLSYRFLETDDEYFSCCVEDPPTQGRWHVHDLHLPDEALRKIYSTNARRILSPAEMK